ncbi:hypothetical protein PAMP_009055 [Pampus punctatissimus]
MSLTQPVTLLSNLEHTYLLSASKTWNRTAMTPSVQFLQVASEGFTETGVRRR